MGRVVLDASAVIAFLKDEVGRSKVEAALPGSFISVVNYSEVVGYHARVGTAEPFIRRMLGKLPMTVFDVDAELSIQAGLLSPTTRERGLSLGDRFCLALAKREGVPALTADRVWLSLEPRLGVQIITIR